MSFLVGSALARTLGGHLWNGLLAIGIGVLVAVWGVTTQVRRRATFGAANVVLAQQKAVQIGECKSDEEIFVDLARRMNLEVGTEAVRDVLDSQLAPAGTKFEKLTKTGFVKPPFAYRKYEDGGFNTPTGKIELYSTRLEEMGYAPLPSSADKPI